MKEIIVVDIDFEVFATEVRFVIGKDMKKVRKAIPKNCRKPMLANDHYSARTVQTNPSAGLKTIVVHSFYTDVSIISHEAVHVANCIIDYCGMHSTNDEPQAYIVGHIMHKVYKAVSDSLDEPKEPNKALKKAAKIAKKQGF